MDSTVHISDIPDDSRLAELLLQWEEAREQGRELTPEELCGDQTELLAELRRRIAALRAFPQASTPTPAEAPAESATSTPRLVEAPGRYQGLHLHARGGLGEVFVAKDCELNRQVALKQLQAKCVGDAHSRQRFLLEAEITGGLEHPGIVPVYSLGAFPDGRPYYAMRFIKGDSLQEAIARFQRHKSLQEAIARFQSRKDKKAQPGTGQQEPVASHSPEFEFRQLLMRFVAVCQAMAYAHSRGVIHRDLKPANLMLGSFGETLVVDWGLAKALHSRGSDTPTNDTALIPNTAGDLAATEVGSALGTPAYMSPEQAAGRVDELGPASDIYSLGATLYAVLTGRAPVSGKDHGEVLRKVERGDFPEPRQVERSVPPALNAICRKAMALRPEDRYPTARALAEDVEQWLADEPVAAYPEPLPQRLRRWARRHQTLVASLAVLLVTGLIAMTISTVLVGHERQVAERERDRANHNYALADDNFRLARSAVDDYLTNVSESDELKAHDLEPLRKNLLESARRFYERFAQERGDEPEQAAELARAYARLGEITHEVGSDREALKLLDQARQRFEQVVRTGQTDAALRHDQAVCLYKLGQVHEQLGDMDQVDTNLHRAVTLMSDLHREDPAQRAYRLQLAQMERDQGNFFVARGRHADAEHAFRDSISECEGLLKEAPKDQRFRAGLASSQAELAGLYAQTNKVAEATKLFQQVQPVLTELMTDNPRVPRYRRLLAGCHDDLGTFALHFGKLAEAQRSYTAGMDLLRKLVDEHPHVVEYRRALATELTHLAIADLHGGKVAQSAAVAKEARSLLDNLARDKTQRPADATVVAKSLWLLGNLAKNQGHRQDAAAAYLQAIPLFERALHAPGAGAQENRSLAGAYSDLAAVYAETGKSAEAATLYNRAETTMEELIRATPTVSQYQRDLASVYVNQGNLDVDRGQADTARRAFERALELQEALVRKQPQYGQIQAEMGVTLSNMGNLWADIGKAQTALGWYDRALDRLESVLKREPARAEARIYLVSALGGKAQALNQLGRYQEALPLFDRALKLDNGIFQGIFRAGRALTLAATGKLDQAQKAVDAALAVPGADSSVLYSAASALAVAAGVAAHNSHRTAAERQALAERYAARAVALLKQCQARGHFHSPSGLRHLREDPELAALRGRKDFKKVLDDVARDKK